ncbi:MAG: hypothetical protein OEV29_13020 [Thermoleophilia bacterium]|nr:hypothetical protein [Thermoleophilia bacterium]
MYYVNEGGSMTEEFEVVDVSESGIDATVPTPDPEWASEEEREEAIGDNKVFTDWGTPDERALES